MTPIFINGRKQGISYHEFHENLISICNEHIANNIALAFALIIYDFTNAQVRKVLQDQEYWDALHTVSGPYLSVFSIHQKPTYRLRGNTYERRDLYSVSTANNPYDATGDILSKYFRLPLNVTYPAIVFFQVDGDSVMDSVIIELKEEFIQSAFLELKEYVAKAVKALRLIKIENRDNRQEIFNLISHDVIASKNWRKLRKLGNISRSVLALGADIGSLGS